MKSALKLILVLLITVVNVRVKARSVELPRDCRAHEGSCAVHAESDLEQLSLANAKVVFARGATVMRTSTGEVRIVRGLVRVRAQGATQIHTLYGELKLSSGEVLIEAVDSVVRFTNLSSDDLKYHPRGEQGEHNLPVGFSTYMAQITKTGVAEAGYPHPAEIEQLIKRWSKVYSKAEKTQFHNAVKDFAFSWEQATQLVGPWYLDTVQREIASAEAEKARLARLKAQRESENKSLREFFHKRIFEP